MGRHCALCTEINENHKPPYWISCEVLRALSTRSLHCSLFADYTVQKYRIGCRVCNNMDINVICNITWDFISVILNRMLFLMSVML